MPGLVGVGYLPLFLGEPPVLDGPRGGCNSPKTAGRVVLTSRFITCTALAQQPLLAWPPTLLCLLSFPERVAALGAEDRRQDDRATIGTGLRLARLVLRPESHLVSSFALGGLAALAARVAVLWGSQALPFVVDASQFG